MSTPGTTTFEPSTFEDLTRTQMLAELRRTQQGLHVASALVGQAATGGYVHTQTTPSASWVITHSIGRVPAVAVYIDGEQVEADVSVTTTTVSVAFPAARSGLAVLT